MEEQKSLNRLQRLCSKAEYCAADVYRKALKDMEGDAGAAARIVASLKEDGYVDDRRYAEAFAREKASLQGWGTVKIRFQLRAKGVGEEAIRDALEQVDGKSAGEKLIRLLAAKDRTLEGDPQRRLKLLKYALSRGYEYDEVEKALKKMAGQ